MTNSERAARLLTEAEGIAEEMRNALAHSRWNLATRRAQEVVELVLKALLSQMGVEYPRAHDVAPVFIDVVRSHGIEVDEQVLDGLGALSARLARLRAPAFYHEVAIGEDEARPAVDGASGVLTFARELLARLRRR